MSWLSFFRKSSADRPAEVKTSTRANRPLRRGVSLPSASRAWDAAKNDRLTAGWRSAGDDINRELKQQLSIIRMRARELEQNSNLARSFLNQCETHIVGPNGFTLQVLGYLGDELDSKGNSHVEWELMQWSKRGVCEITGRYSLHGAQRTCVRTTARDGEMLIRLHDVRSTKNNPWGFVIELLDPSRLDHMCNVDLKNGNRVRLGVEMNQAGRPVAYWLNKGERSGWVSERDRHERVLAEDLIHWFEADRPEQLRGVSWMASAMTSVHQLDKYNEAAVVAARAGASKMGFYTQTEVGAGSLALADDEDEDGDLYQEFEPGHFGTLPKGYGFVGFDPKYPHENYDPFNKTVKRDMAMGFGVSYHGLTGDLTDVNFSSIRSGTLEERERWKVRQDSFASAVMERIYLRWLSNAALHGRLGMGSLSQEDQIARYTMHKWQGRRWSWVDPKKDIEAVLLAMSVGLNSPQHAGDEMGVDVEEMLEQIAEFQKMMKDKGITFPVTAQSSASNDEEQDNANNANAQD